MKSQENILNNTRKYRITKKGVLTNIYNHCKNRREIEFSLKEFQGKYIDDIYMLKNNKVVKVFNSQREAIITTKLNQSGISMCLNGKRNTCGGYVWVYENSELLGGE